MTRRRWIGVVAALSCVLAGCTAGGVDPPSSTSVASSPSAVASSPTLGSSPTPTPQWTDEQQAVIDAVEAYLTEWAYIGQNLTTVDWNTIYEVAKEPQATGVLQVWQRWNHQGWHLVGAPVFTPASVAATMTDSLGSYYSVRGCFSVENSHPADAGGVPVIDDEQRKRGVLTYEVVLTWDGLYRVTDSHSEEESC